REFGGSTRPKKRKVQRPFDPKGALHLTLKAGGDARSMLHPELKWHIWGHFDRVAGKRSIRVYRYANVGNHLHLLLQASSRREFQAFLREFSGAVAVTMTGAAKGRPKKFWAHLAWSKVVGWGRQFKNAARYVMLNVLEGTGHRDRKLLERLEQE